MAHLELEKLDGSPTWPDDPNRPRIHLADRLELEDAGDADDAPTDDGWEDEE
jgi:hypothetical protein